MIASIASIEFVLLLIQGASVASSALGPRSLQGTNADKLLTKGLLPGKILAPLDMQAIAEHDAKSVGRLAPLRFGIHEKVSLAPRDPNGGAWEQDGTVWRYRVQAGSEDCVSLSFGFSRFRLDEGMELYIYGEEEEDGEREVLGPYTFLHNNERTNQLWTRPIASCDVVLELDLSKSVAPERIDLVLSVISIGYLEVGINRHPTRRRELSGSCNVDVACPEGDGWEDEIAAVGHMQFERDGGTYVCTGTMINNAEQDRRSLFLTANHCLSCQDVADTLKVYWNFQTPTCGGTPTQSASGDPPAGATVLFTKALTDISLLELDSAPRAKDHVSYAGWDASGSSAVDGVVGIHHPLGHEKRISVEEDATDTTHYDSNHVHDGGNHIRVSGWDVGTTEGGSSGSALFDHNHRIIGQLHGGYAGCTSSGSSNGLSDWYGRLSVSFSFGLSAVLDPFERGYTHMDTLAHGASASLPSALNHTPTDTPAQQPSGCGFNQIDGDEKCDGSDLGGKSCTDFGVAFLPNEGSLKCKNDCSGFDTSECHKLVFERSGISVPKNYIFRSSFELSQAEHDTLSWLKVELLGNCGDADLYVKFGSDVSTSDYDCRSWDSGSNEECLSDGIAVLNTRITPQVGTYSYGVVGFDTPSNDNQIHNLTVRVVTTGNQHQNTQCLPPFPDFSEAGFDDSFRGWYDVQGCGRCNEYCAWVGNSGSGGDPSIQTEHLDSFWTCRVFGQPTFHTQPYPGAFTAQRCAVGYGGIPPTAAPTKQPTFAPSFAPTASPTTSPTTTPTGSPTTTPTGSPTPPPSLAPIAPGSTPKPSPAPTIEGIDLSNLNINGLPAEAGVNGSGSGSSVIGGVAVVHAVVMQAAAAFIFVFM